MWFVLIGCLLVLLKLADLGPVAAWTWWWVLAPFAAAAAWWIFADSSGWTQRRAMERDAARTKERRAQHLKAMGLDSFEKGKGRRDSK